MGVRTRRVATLLGACLRVVELRDNRAFRRGKKRVFRK